jgi:TPR repeat protein
VATKRRKMLSRTVRVVLAAWLMGAALEGTAVAGPFRDGVAAYNRGDFAEALKWFSKAAEQGDAFAQSPIV